MDKVNKTADRFRAIRESLGLTQQEIAARLFLSRNYIAQIETGLREPSIRVVNDIESLAARGVEKVKHLSTKSADKAHLKTGGREPSVIAEENDNYGTVASRIPQRREPSNRADCLAYVLKLLDAAEASGNPDNFPAIMARLKKQFPLDEWDEKPE